MPPPVVHIGFHKTGTSWFQHAVYPLVTSHHLVDRDLVRAALMGGDAFDFDPTATRAALEEGADGKPLLISEEELSGVLHIGVASTYIAKEVAARIHATLPDAHIVIAVRAQPDAAASWYIQYVREGGTASPHRYLFADDYLFPGRNMLFKTARFDFAQLDYIGLIDHYDALFGRDRVHVLAYEQLANAPDQLLARLQALGLAFAPADVPGDRVNVAYRKAVLPVARALNLFTGRSVANKRVLVHVPFWFRIRRSVLEQADRLPLLGGRARADDVIDQATRAWIGQRFAASNRRLAERMGIDLAALGYPVADLTAPVGRPRRSALFRWMRK